MDEKDQYVRIGACVAAFGIGVLAALVVVVVAQRAEEFDNFRISFKGPVTGLGIGTSVHYNGIDVGNVSEMALDTADPQRVLFTVKVRQGLNIRQDSVATINSASLIGGSRVLEITGGTRLAPVIPVVEHPPYPFIRSKDGGFAQIEKAMPEISKKMDTIMTRYREVTGSGNQRAIENITNNYNRVSKSFERSDLGSMQSSYDQAAKNLSAKNLQTESTAKAVDQTSKKFSRLGANTQKFSDDKFDGSFTQLKKEFQRLSKSLGELGEKIEKRPSSFLKGDRQEGYDAKPLPNPSPKE